MYKRKQEEMAPNLHDAAAFARSFDTNMAKRPRHHPVHQPIVTRILDCDRSKASANTQRCGSEVLSCLEQVQADQRSVRSELMHLRQQTQHNRQEVTEYALVFAKEIKCVKETIDLLMLQMRQALSSSSATFDDLNIMSHYVS